MSASTTTSAFSSLSNFSLLTFCKGSSLFWNTSLKDSEETFSTYSVYIIRTEETLDTIISKFKITKEELEAYNDLSNIGVGSKLIIPLNNESD